MFGNRMKHCLLCLLKTKSLASDFTLLKGSVILLYFISFLHSYAAAWATHATCLKSPPIGQNSKRRNESSELADLFNRWESLREKSKRPTIIQHLGFNNSWFIIIVILENLMKRPRSPCWLQTEILVVDTRQERNVWMILHFVWLAGQGHQKKKNTYDKNSDCGSKTLPKLLKRRGPPFFGIIYVKKIYLYSSLSV